MKLTNTQRQILQKVADQLGDATGHLHLLMEDPQLGETDKDRIQELFDTVYDAMCTIHNDIFE